MATTTTASASGQKNSYATSIIIIGALFFIFGFVTWLNGTLIPFLKIACELTNFQAYFVTFAFYISYFFLAIPSSWILHRTGFKNGMALGLLVMAVGSLVFIPAAETRTFGLFLTGLFIQGAGLSLLQTASNPYIVILGPIESAAKRISIMGICNKTAGILSPLILGAIVLKNVDSIKDTVATTTDSVVKAGLLNELAGRVIVPYIIIAIVLAALALWVKYSPLQNIDTDQEEQHVNDATHGKTSIFQFPYFVMGIITLFLYAGCEVIAGDTVALYAMSTGIATNKAIVFTSYTLFSMVVGYLIGIALIPKTISQSRALGISAVIGFLLAMTAIMIKGTASVYFISLLGFANSIMWPAIWPLALGGLGKFTKIASALLVMCIAGCAVLPLLYGKIADLLGPGTVENFQQLSAEAQRHLVFSGRHTAYWIVVPCYIWIAFYAFKGHKVGRPAEVGD